MSADDSSRVTIGIAFGNSYSSIARVAEGKAEVIANEEGDRQIPSILSYVEGEEASGTQAKAQLIRNPKNTVAYFKELIGQEFKSIDPTPCHPSAHPQQQDNSVAFSIRDTEAEDARVVSVSEITTRHLRKLAASATDFLGKTVDSAVLTVPTNFTEEQKKALSAAAKEAGIEVLQYIHDPVAAVLAYDARGSEPSDKNIVVADLGGTRSDIAIIASRGGIYTILATQHDYDVSGSQLDKALVDHFAKEFLKKHKSADDPRENAKSLAKLTMESEAVKKALCLGTTASFSTESLSSGIDYTVSINRTRYELLGSKVFAAITRLVLSTVEKAGLDPIDISEVILSGGTSHTPRIARNLAGAFPETTIISAPATRTDAINPSELAARGAAIQASLISEFDLEDIRESSHPVVTGAPHLSAALGVLCISSDEKSHGVFVPLVEAETPVPVRRTKVFGVPGAGGDVLIKLCEATSEVVIKKIEKKPEPKSNGKKDDSDDDDSEDESEEEDEEVKERKWTVKSVVAEAAIRGTKKGSKIEVQLNIGADLAVNIVAREVGGKGGVRGVVQA